MHNILDTDDGDGDWLLGGADAEHTHKRGRISLKARSGPASASHKIRWALHQDVLKAWYEPGNLRSGPGKKTTGTIYIWALHRTREPKVRLF